MAAALSVARDVAEAELDGFRVEYVSEDGTQHQVPLADARTVRFEAMAPARRFAVRKGQRHLPGLWWSSTVAGHVGYESWLERDHVMWLDWDRSVVGIVDRTGWQGRGARAGLLRPPGGRLGGSSRLPAGGAPAGEGPGQVRGDAAGVRAGGLGVLAGRRAGPDRDGEPAVAGRVPASAP